MMGNNELTDTEIALFGLIKKALFGIPFIQPDHVNWDDVYQEAQKQAVSGVVEKYVPESAGFQWRQVDAICIGNNIRYLHAQSELIELFKAHNIPLSILKGTAAAVYYPDPILRMMGDIDFIVPQDCFDKACSLMVENGYALHMGNPMYTRHKGFFKDKISFELHHHFSYDDLDIEHYIIDGLKKPDVGNINGILFPMLPKLANGLVLLAHMRNHLQSGLGLRQMIDWMMYVDKVLDDDFWKSEFRESAASVGMDKLAIISTRMCQKYLGLRDNICWCKEADEKLCDLLIRNLMSYGNFGIKHGEGNKIEKVITRVKKNGAFRYLQKSGEGTWKLYHQHKCLKPFCWLYQICRLIKKGFQSKRGNKVFQDMEMSRDRYDLLKKLNVIH